MEKIDDDGQVESMTHSLSSLNVSESENKDKKEKEKKPFPIQMLLPKKLL